MGCWVREIAKKRGVGGEGRNMFKEFVWHGKERAPGASAVTSDTWGCLKEV